MKKDRLHKTRIKAENEYKFYSVSELSEKITSQEANERLFALMIMQKQIKQGDSPKNYFELAKKLICDPDNNCRWQSLIVISELINSHPDLVWKIILKYGDSKDTDMRTAVSTLLLEHLLDFDFDKYFPKIRREILNGRQRFIDTLEGCWFDNGSGTHYKKVQSFVKKAKRGLNKEQFEK